MSKLTLETPKQDEPKENGCAQGLILIVSGAVVVYSIYVLLSI